MPPAGVGNNRGRAGLYAVTAVVVGWQTFRLMMWGVWGKPSNVWEFVALFGAFVLLYGAAAAYDKALRGEKIAASFGCVLVWCFYGPAIWNTLADEHARLDLVVLAGPVLLLVSSIVVIHVLLDWLDPPAQTSPD